MSPHRAKVSWFLGDGDFLKRRYSRVHRISFAGDVEIPGSASSTVVPAPWSSAAAVDPEAAFTASLSACHMLWFLDHASRAGFVVEAYQDDAEGFLGKDLAGRMAMTRVVLRPRITFGGAARPTAVDVDALHEAAHTDCFIANSVLSRVEIETVSEGLAIP